MYGAGSAACLAAGTSALLDPLLVGLSKCIADCF